MSFQKLSSFRKLLLKLKDKKQYQLYKYRLELSRAPQIRHEFNFTGQVSFKHSGNAGDVIYALPSIGAISGGLPVNLFLNVNVNTDYGKGNYHPYGNVMLTPKSAEMLMPLLKYQQNIQSCKIYQDEPIDVDLDLFRKFPLFKGLGNIARWYFYVFGIQADLSKPWLTAPIDHRYSQCIVIARSHRYRNPDIDFSFLSQYGELIFVGLKEEYEDMKEMIPQLKYQPVNDFLELAAIINSCRLFIGNQSFPFSIAEALKVKRVLEVCHYCPNVNVEGANGFDFCYQQPFEKTVALALSR
jgi:hypothetical protein